jgi:PAS domain S-box-containing protein
MARDITERKQAEEALRRSEHELSIRNKIANVFLTVPDDEMYSEVLGVILEAMESKYGVFGYLAEDGAMVVPSMTRTIWDKCAVSDKDIVFPRDTWGDSIWPRAIREKKTLFSNERSTRVPEGHIPILRNISLPIIHQGEPIGLIQVANKETDYDEKDIHLLETIGSVIAPILNARLERDKQEKKRKQAEEALRERSHDLGERMKELNCLYWLSQLTADPDSSIDEVLSELVELIPPSWQYSDITCAKIVFEDQQFHTHNYRETPWRQSANIMVSGRQAGTLDVYYLEEKPEIDEGPFLKEERNLIEALAGEVGKYVEREQAEEVLSRTIAEYTAMIDTVPAMIYLKDIDHHYVVANEAFCTAVGKNLDDIIGKTDNGIWPWEKADEFHKADKLVMEEDRKVVHQDEQIIDAKGETKWISTTKVPVHDSQGLVTGVVGLVQDVTEYHRSREQLIQSDKLAAIGTLAAGVAHEINNPIGFISSNLHTMNKYLKKMNSYIERTGPEEDEDKEAILEILTDFADAVGESTEGTTRVKNIVADLKSFSRVDRAEKELTNINEGIESTLNMVWNELKYHCKVEKDLGDMPDLYCIPNQLNQVFMNVFLNAGHATKGQSGLINIRTWADDANIYVSVKDNGVGIPKDTMKKIFEPFFTTKDVGEGTGLGLSLAFDIIKKHGGNIEVKSEVGVGTEFIVALPCEGVPVG